MPHLLLIDAHAVLHRAYHSIPLLSVNGQPVNALYGFYSMLLSALRDLVPTHLLVCADSPGPTFRQQEYVAYRAQRRPADRELISQLPLLPTTLGTALIPVLAMGGYEADDLLASASRQLVKKSQVTIITGDKDLMQLVTPRVSLYMPVRGLSQISLVGPREVEARLGVKPSQVVDLKALMGDPSDNYPGVEGIGPKTASDLLAQYPSLNDIYSHLGDLSPNTRQKLETSRDNAYLSQKLASLVDNIPLALSLKSCRFGPDQVSGLDQLFSDYHFKSLSLRLHKLFPSTSPPKSSPPPASQFSLF